MARTDRLVLTGWLLSLAVSPAAVVSYSMQSSVRGTSVCQAGHSKATLVLTKRHANNSQYLTAHQHAGVHGSQQLLYRPSEYIFQRDAARIGSRTTWESDDGRTRNVAELVNIDDLPQKAPLPRRPARPVTASGPRYAAAAAPTSTAPSPRTARTACRPRPDTCTAAGAV